MKHLRKADKKATKLARQESEEGKEVMLPWLRERLSLPPRQQGSSKFGSMLRRVSVSSASRTGGSSSGPSRSTSESNLAGMAPLVRTVYRQKPTCMCCFLTNWKHRVLTPVLPTSCADSVLEIAEVQTKEIDYCLSSRDYDRRLGVHMSVRKYRSIRC